MRFLSLLLLLLPPFLLFAQPRKLTAETAVKQVTVFSSGARVERSASIVITPGRTEISFPGLSNGLDGQSVQLKADANLTLLAVQVSPDFLSSRKIDQEEGGLRNRIGALNDRIQLDNRMLEVYRQEEQMLIKNQKVDGRAAELKEALDLQRGRLTDIYQRQLEIGKRVEASQQELQGLKSQLQEIGKKRDSVNYVVTALVESRETRSTTFQLSYNVAHAGWYPTYDVRVTDIASPLQVLMNAHVFQTSGETWKDVSLMLSTGSPKENATPPHLEPWKVGFYDPSVTWQAGGQAGSVSGRVANEKGEPIPGVTVMIKGTKAGTITDNNGFFRLTQVPPGAVGVFSSVGFVSREVPLKTGYLTVALEESAMALSEVVVTALGMEGGTAGVEVRDSRFKRKPSEIQPVAVVTQYQPTATVYRVEEKYTLETDGKTTTIGVKQIGIPTLFEYYSAPKADPSAFLTAGVTDWEGYDLQSGEASLYFEGTFLGKTYMDLATAGDTLSLSLGKDNGLKIVRRLVKEFTSRRSIGSNRTESRQYEIVLRNTKKVPVTILVHEQVPLSITREITVEDVKAPEGELDKETGLVRWLVTLQPGQEKKLSLGFSVKYPRGRKVVID